MARRKVYIAPFLPDGSGYDAFREVTSDVVYQSLGTISYKLDVSDYDIGIFTNAGLNLNLQNSLGLYSDVDNDQSIFQFKRTGSLIKVTWDEADWDFFPGLSKPGEIAGGEITVFTGILNDDATVLQLKGQLITFNILGLESILDQVVIPDWFNAPPADKSVQNLIQILLQTANIGVLVPVWTIDNTQVNPGNNIVWDDLTVFANKTCRDVLNELLEASNSVLYMNGTTPVVSGRIASTNIAYKFYGQGSTLGPENLTDIQDIRTGLNRTFNFLTFNGSSPPVSSVDVSSVDKYGVRLKDITVDGLTTQATQQAVVDAIRQEFSVPKQEFVLIAPLTPKILQLQLLGKISLDYPLVPVDTGNPPLYGVAIYDKDKFPTNLSSFLVLPTDYYKIIALDFDLANNQAKLTLRLA